MTDLPLAQSFLSMPSFSLLMVSVSLTSAFSSVIRTWPVLMLLELTLPAPLEPPAASVILLTPPPLTAGLDFLRDTLVLVSLPRISFVLRKSKMVLPVVPSWSEVSPTCGLKLVRVRVKVAVRGAGSD